ncbi:MAG: efflux RND transporter permease subunit [Planctomycetota bacterium]|nr:efflux RND transporter permease subunit [Planctomycetota bacterium]
MNLTALSVRNPIAAKLLTALIIATGLASLASLRREFVPPAPIDEASITTTYHGATPEEIDRMVARPLERSVVDIPGVRTVDSRIFEGICYTLLVLETDIDQSQVMDDLRSAVERTRPDLPPGIEEPIVTLHRRYNALMELVLYGDVTEATLRRAAIDFREELTRSPDISRVRLQGVRRRELWIETDQERLELFQVDYQQLADAIATANRDFPGGELKSDRGRMRLRTLGESVDPEDLESLVLEARPDGSTIRIRDVAEVRDTYEERLELGRWQGQRAVRVQVMKTPEQDALRIANQIRSLVGQKGDLLAGAVQIHIIQDYSESIEDRLSILWESAWQGLLLVLLVQAPFLNLRLAFWVALGIPVSFFGTFVMMRAFDLTLNLYTLGALVVALGMIVDDAVVVGESIFSKMKAGMPPARACIEGPRAVMRPVLTASLTTIIAWLPLGFISGRLGSLLEVMPYVLISALLVSLLECFVMMPGHLAHPFPWRLGPLVGWANKLGRARDAAIHRVLVAPFHKIARLLLRWRYVTLAGILAALVALAGLMASGRIPFVLNPQGDTGRLRVRVEMAAGTDGMTTDATLQEIAAYAESLPEVSGCFSVVGTLEMTRGGSAASDPVTTGRLQAYLLPANVREAKGLRNIDEVIHAIREACVDVPGANSIQVSRPITVQGRDLELVLTGNDTNLLQDATRYVRQRVASFKGVTSTEDDFQRGKRETRIVLKDRARTLGLSARDVAQQVRAAVHGIKAQEIHSGSEEIRVLVRLADASQRALSDSSQLTIATPKGDRVPLTEVADIDTIRGIGALYRWGLQPSAGVRVNIDKTQGNVAAITASLREELEDIGTRFPGVSVNFEGHERVGDESIRFLTQVGFPVALLLIYVIIAMAFASYLQPLLVMSVIPVAIAGAIYGHFLMASPVTFVSLLACVALTGIVVNDSLVLLDKLRECRASGLPAFEAATRASTDRLRAILITTLTTMAGVAPLMLTKNVHAQIVVPMAIVLFFGLAFGTIVLLVLLPSGYLIAEDIKRLLRWLRTGRGEAPPSPRDA